MVKACLKGSTIYASRSFEGTENKICFDPKASRKDTFEEAMRQRVFTLNCT